MSQDRIATPVGLNSAGRLYLGLVITAGLAVVGISIHRLLVAPVDPQWYLLAALTIVSGSLTVKLPSIPATISISETFVFASVLLFGPAAGTITVALDGLVISFWMAKRRPEWYRALFNMAAPAVSIWTASQVFFSIAGPQSLLSHAIEVNGLLLPLVVFTVLFFGLNSGLVTLAIGFETGESRYRIWRENFRWVSLNYFCGASIALLLVVYARTVDIRFIAVILPLLLVLYLTFKTTMQRVEDANSHVREVNRLYLSTIETIAMAIDAKDQITHGHIRRVQAFALGLADRIGVTDIQLLKAIEAAALLHDTGKLAVPEYILNKPGKLTPAEFEKMKLHVTVGAEILTAVDFPFPVVPIVKCHHENWDGTGYPNGIKGTDIPIGARILSVVDCFDALTSDRPYRPRLSAEEALEILFQRRGSMYDPLVVDTFARVYQEIAPEQEPTREGSQALGEIIVATSQPTLSVPVALAMGEPAAADAPTAFDLAEAFAGRATVENICVTLSKHVRQLIPSTLSVFYLYDRATDELEARHASGSGAAFVKGLRMDPGQRLSGWVAANRRTITNSDAALDLPEIARKTDPPLRNCLSTPLLVGEDLIGVLALYTSERDGFSDEQRDTLEAIAVQVAFGLKQARAFDVGQAGPTAPIPSRRESALVRVAQSR
jgi:putative nucleotidyltransferase with HDIG domain